MLAAGTRFAYTNRWMIDVKDYGSEFYEIYHVVGSTPKSLLLLNAMLFSGNINVQGNELMDKVVSAWKCKQPMLNQNTTPRRYMLKKDKDGDYFVEGKGTAMRRIRLKGGPNPVRYLETSPNPPLCTTTGKKRARAH